MRHLGKRAYIFGVLAVVFASVGVVGAITDTAHETRIGKESGGDGGDGRPPSPDPRPKEDKGIWNPGIGF